MFFSITVRPDCALLFCAILFPKCGWWSYINSKVQFRAPLEWLCRQRSLEKQVTPLVLSSHLHHDWDRVDVLPPYVYTNVCEWFICLSWGRVNTGTGLMWSQVWCTPYLGLSLESTDWQSEVSSITLHSNKTRILTKDWMKWKSVRPDVLGFSLINT